MDPAILAGPRTAVLGRVIEIVDRSSTPRPPWTERPINTSFATINTRMRLNFFSRNTAQSDAASINGDRPQADDQPRTGRTFPADEVAWGITIRNGFDEMDDPLYHRGITQHAYLEGNDSVSICGFRPPQSGPRTRRRARLGLPTTGIHPLCGTCARMVVAARPRVSVPVTPGRAPVAIPVTPGAPAPGPIPAPASAAGPAAVDVAARATIAPSPAARPGPSGAPGAARPWGWADRADGLDPRKTAASGLLDRGVHARIDD